MTRRLASYLLVVSTACGGTDAIEHPGAQDATVPGGADAGTSTAVVEHPRTACPHIDLGDQVPVQWTGDTTDLPNFVQSSRLEWGDAPDDTLSFTAPESGGYVIYFEADSENHGFGVSAEDYESRTYYSPSDCPLPGQTKLIDGVYNHNQPEYPLTLAAGQTILLWVSGTTWATGPTASYTLRIQKAASGKLNRMFVSSTTSTGAMGGLAGADTRCQQAAQAAGLDGDWIAWLSTANQNAIDRITNAGPWVRVDGSYVFADRADLADPFANLMNGLWLDENGNWLASDRIWTGTGADGRYIDSIGGNCQGWTSGSMADQARIGQVGRQDNAWTSNTATSCDQSGTRLICLEP